MGLGLTILTDPGWFPYTRKLARYLWSLVQSVAWTVGSTVVNGVAVIRFLFRGRLGIKPLLAQSAFIGVDTLGISLVMTMVSGMVIALQLAKEMSKQGAGNYVGALVSMALLRELAPIMTGFAVIAMAGSAFAAELSTMQITRQVDALRVLHVHPVRYLVLPRVIAGMWVLPMMTLLTAAAGILGGMLVSYGVAELPFHTYLDSVWQQTRLKDIFCMLLKAGVFGGFITLLSATIGLNARGGAKEVGEATTQTVVWCFVVMALVDYVLTFLFYGANN